MDGLYGHIGLRGDCADVRATPSGDGYALLWIDGLSISITTSSAQRLADAIVSPARAVA